MSTVAAMVPGPGSGAPGVPVSRRGSGLDGAAVPGAGSRRVLGAGSRAVPVAGTGPGPQPGQPPGVHAAAEPRRGNRGQLTAAQRLAVASITVTTLGLAAYGAAGSYVSVRNLAAAHHVPLPALVPAGIDGGLIGTVALDIVLTWTGYPLAWLRAVARVFVAGTVAANMLAGWPDPVSVGLHAAPPLLILVFVEAARSVLLRAGSDGRWREPIPAARWVMAPWPTFVLWRRMVLWRINSYADAVDMELSRRQAIIRLTAHYGSGWRDSAPDDLVWMLLNGVRVADACARVAQITASPGEGAGGGTGSGTRGRNRAGTGTAGRPGNRAGASAGNRPEPRHGNQPGRVGTAAGNRAPGRGDLLGQARRIAIDHLATSGREIKVAELALALGRRKKLAGDLLREIRAHADPPAGGSVAPPGPGEEAAG
jgi:Protein of unknown function (DUF2637)